MCTHPHGAALVGLITLILNTFFLFLSFQKNKNENGKNLKKEKPWQRCSDWNPFNTGHKAITIKKTWILVCIVPTQEGSILGQSAWAKKVCTLRSFFFHKMTSNYLVLSRDDLPLVVRSPGKKPLIESPSGADPGFFLGGGALVSCSTSTPINHIVFFLQNTSCIRKPQVISGGGGGAHPLHPPPRSASALCDWKEVGQSKVKKKFTRNWVPRHNSVLARR